MLFEPKFWIEIFALLVVSWKRLRDFAICFVCVLRELNLCSDWKEPASVLMRLSVPSGLCLDGLMLNLGALLVRAIISTFLYDDDTSKVSFFKILFRIVDSEIPFASRFCLLWLESSIFCCSYCLWSSMKLSILIAEIFFLR